MKLGIYMGCFNPPHKGHINIVNYLLDNGFIDKILIVPTLSYWDKYNLIDIKDRINMLKIFQNDKIIIDDKHNDLIYTIDLVRKIEKEHLKEELFIIMGADNIINLDKWKNYQELLKYNIIVMNRDNIDIKKYTSKLNGKFIIINEYEQVNISSSEIRNNLNSKYLDERVLDYIKKHNLYK